MIIRLITSTATAFSLVFGAAIPVSAGSPIIDRIKRNLGFMGLELQGDPENPDEAEGLAEAALGRVIGSLLAFLAVIFFILMIYAGVVWMTSAGNEEKVNKAKRMIIAAIIGIGVVSLAYLITVLVFTVFAV